MPRDKDVVCEVTELVHSPVHSAPLARIKTPDGDTTLLQRLKASPSVVKWPSETTSLSDQATSLKSATFLKEQP